MEQLISKEELKAKLDRGDPFLLIMALSEAAFNAQHIPGSIYMDRIEMVEQLDRNADIVVYCTGGSCSASRWGYDVLTSRGFKYVRRYPGGLEEWSAAGYPLEGEMVEQS